MKKLILILSGIFLGSFAHAQTPVISDVFECKMEITDYKTNSGVTSSGSDVGTRLLVPAQMPGQDYEVTKAGIKVGAGLVLPTARYDFQYELNYAFAKRMVLGSVEARQQACEAVSIKICHSNPGGESLCVMKARSCMVPQNPFDPVLGWGNTTLLQGIPIFNERLLQGFQTTIEATPQEPRGVNFSVTCKFKESYY